MIRRFAAVASGQREQRRNGGTDMNENFVLNPTARRVIVGNDIYEMAELIGHPGYLVAHVQGVNPVMCLRESDGAVRWFRSIFNATEWARRTQ
jgi:hypothetical protein